MGDSKISGQMSDKSLRSLEGSDYQSDRDPENEGIFDWIKRTYELPQKTVQDLCGTETVLYLSFLKFSFFLFLALSIACSLPLLTTYSKLSYNNSCYPVNRQGNIF